LQIEGRAADNLEDVGGGGLPLKRLAQFVQQPRILDGDNRLRGEVLEQLDLLVGERLNPLAIGRDCAEERILLAHWHGDRRASAAKVGESDQPRIALEIWRHHSDVIDVHRLLGPANLSLAALGMNAEWHVLGRGERRRYVVDRGNTGYVCII